MTRTILLATTALILTAGSAFAAEASQTAEAPASAVAGEAGQPGVLVFQPDFFAAQRPNTALDMINRVPGFSVNDGSGARGFEGAVGNILINGNRPASKNDTGSNVLSRTLASRVERIELIRGGAAGIDMQGYSVVVNVILKSGTSRQSILTYNGSLFEGGHDVHGGSYQFTASNGDRTWGVTLATASAPAIPTAWAGSCAATPPETSPATSIISTTATAAATRSAATIRGRWSAARST